VQGSIADIPVAGDFDLICAFDVLEHLRDGAQALRQLRQRLRPGGRLLLTVPAHMQLWSYSDQAAEHCRRYAPGVLHSTLVDAGFTVDYSTQFMLLLYPILRLVRRFATWRAGQAAETRAFELTAQEFRVVPGLNRCMSWLVSAELPLIRARRSMQLGTSLLALAHTDAAP
jgi:SAM-dependent methyltransferase